MARFVSRLFIAFVAAIALAAGLAACGDDNADLDPATVLVETLGNDEHVSSGTFDFTLGGSVEGTQSATGDVSLSGAFQSDPDDPAAIPQLQLDGSASGDAAGTSVDFEGGLIVTDGNAYITYQDETYELGASLYNAFTAMAAQTMAAQGGLGLGATGAEDAAPTEGATGAEGATAGQCPVLMEQAGGNPEACDQIDALSWFDLTNEGTEEIEGADTVHIHGTVDVPTMIDNINATITAAEIPEVEEIPEETATQIEDAVSELSFDVFSGAEDRLLRGFDLNFVVDASAVEGAEDSGVTSAEFDISTRLGDVNSVQTIEAPTDAQPIDDLLEQFGLSSETIQSALSRTGRPARRSTRRRSGK